MLLCTCLYWFCWACIICQVQKFNCNEEKSPVEEVMSGLSFKAKRKSSFILQNTFPLCWMHPEPVGGMSVSDLMPHALQDTQPCSHSPHRREAQETIYSPSCWHQLSSWTTHRRYHWIRVSQPEASPRLQHQVPPTFRLWNGGSSGEDH